MFWQSRPGDADNNIILLDSDGALAYRNLFEIADRLFSPLGRGIMAVICDRIEDCHRIWGRFARHCALLLDSTTDKASLFYLIDRYEAEYLWAHQDFSADGYDQVTRFGKQILWRRRSRSDQNDISPELAALIPTSGSTGIQRPFD